MMLEDEHEHAVGRADGEQVEDDRFQRYDDRTERDQQEHEGEQQDEHEDVGEPVLQLAGEVDVFRDVARDGRLDAGDGADRPRNQLVAERQDRVAARLVVAGSAQRQEQGRRAAVVVRRCEHRFVADAACNGELLESPPLRAQGGSVSRRYGCDDLGRLRCARELTTDVRDGAQFGNVLR